MQETILTRIVRDKKIWLAERQQQQPLATFLSQITPSNRSFYDTLQEDKTHFILECKKASPSKGVIRDDFDPRVIARTYRPYASVISVLTDEKYFQGSFDYLPQVSAETYQPILCKDFIIDPYQIYLARFHQADAILLMLSVLDDQHYRQLAEVAHSLDMGVLTEISNPEEMHRAIALQAQVVGINNRDLRDLSIDLDRTRQLSQHLPPGVRVISESGIRLHRQVRTLSQYADGFLIGSALMAEPNLDTAIRSVILGDNKVCGLTRAEDAAAAHAAGATCGGLIFVSRSPRSVDVAKAQQVITGAPLKWTGVFCNARIETVCHNAATLNLHAVQLHGDEDQEYIATLRKQLPATCQIWQALSISDTLPERITQYVDRYVFDNGSGGTGHCFNWSLLEGVNLDNVLLAGGLNADNVLQAAQLGCSGLDFNSGGESQPGIKDHQCLNSIFNRLRQY